MVKINSVKQSNQSINTKYESYQETGLFRTEQNEVLNDNVKHLLGCCTCDSPVIKIPDKFRDEMQIFIKTIDDKILTFEMKHSNKIRDVKMKIEEKTKILVDQQNLFYQGEILNDDNKTIDEYQICDQSIIGIIARLKGGMQIIVKSIDGRSFTIEIERADKIINVKCKIQDKIGLHRDKQILIFQGEILDDDKSIDEYQICEKSVINVVDKSGPGEIKIFQKATDGRKISFESQVKLRICAKTMDGETVEIELTTSDKIINIKQKIEDEIGLHPDEQKLIYQGRELDDYKSIDEYQITEKSVIVVKQLGNRMQIYAKTIVGKTYLFVVQKSDKIIDLKHSIEKKLGLPSEEQKLVYKGENLEDDKTCYEYQICDQSVINIVARLGDEIKIIAATRDGKTVSIDVCKSERVIDMKYKIQEKLGLHPGEQILFYEGRILYDDYKTIDEYQICDKSVITIAVGWRYGGMQIFVKTMNGKQVPLEVLKMEKIVDIKNKIQEKMGLNIDEQKLIYQDEILDDNNKTIEEYQICEKSVINIVIKFKNEIQIFIKISNKSLIPINIAKTCKISEVKSKLEQLTGMQFAVNNLVYENKILHNEKLLIDYQIDDGCVISIDEDSQFFLFLQAIKSGSLERVQDLYDIKFNRKHYSASPMHYACQQNNVEIVKFLIKNDFEINSMDEESKKPIHYACINGCVKILEILIEHKCNLEERDSCGMKPIHLACLNGNIQNVKLLIANRCNLESQDYSSNRPIHLAILAGNIDIVKILIQNKCKIDVFDNSNKSPFNIKEKGNLSEIIELLNEEISGRMIEKMITELKLECNNNCNHKCCPTSLRNKTFNIGVKIGKGGYGEVYQCKLSQSSHQIAIKLIPRSEKDSKNIEGNINRFIEKINYKRIIKYFGAVTKEENIFILMEFMSGGSLRSKICMNPPMTTSNVIHYTIQILEGLQFLHRNKIIHRDIKPDNILLDGDGNVKLTDFGLGLLLGTIDNRTTEASTFCGTPYYMSPEIISGEAYSYGADIWSLGVTVIEMATGKRPYHDEPLAFQSVMFRIGTAKKIPYQLPDSSPNNLKLIIDQMLNPGPFKRPTATELINKLKIIQ